MVNQKSVLVILVALLLLVASNPSAGTSQESIAIAPESTIEVVFVSPVPVIEASPTSETTRQLPKPTAAATKAPTVAPSATKTASPAPTATPRPTNTPVDTMTPKPTNTARPTLPPTQPSVPKAEPTAEPSAVPTTEPPGAGGPVFVQVGQQLSYEQLAMCLTGFYGEEGTTPDGNVYGNVTSIDAAGKKLTLQNGSADVSNVTDVYLRFVLNNDPMARKGQLHYAKLSISIDQLLNILQPGQWVVAGGGGPSIHVACNAYE